ncbi:3-oxoacid CoA-transferase subunit B [Mycobacteroides abscessus subsp. bolletii]|nr:3-oxoacid CoA-transferase subunit B [Mycobacteroides abscessus]SKG75290.1 3-oxoacid CoA-transferase subunit B [Mycobacteroides abscessus subsp. bolletii]SKH25926.1 3-oxoacid CoA-transferase subunit B [Mycobacteroides abscessus subsp. bolletii]
MSDVHEHLNRGPLTKNELAAAVARDIPRGAVVNLGIGLPTSVADHLSPADGVLLHTENGMLGMGPEAHGNAIDPDLINAGKIPVTELPGAAYFHHADSFAMMRGGHLDVCVMGAFQVSARGDLANWSTGVRDAIPAVGGAMDLAIGAKAIFVMMSLFAKDGTPKLVDRCTFPLTGRSCVRVIYSDLAIIELHPVLGALARETFGVSVEALSTKLGIALNVSRTTTQQDQTDPVTR